MASPSLFPAEDTSPATPTPLTEKLCCPICTSIFDRPLELYCGAIVCLECCCKWIQISHSLSCPCCYNHSLNSSTIQLPSPLIASLVESLVVNCGKRCGKLVRVGQYHQHLAGNCKSHYHQLVDSPSKMTIRDVLAKPTTSPATPMEMRAAEHLVRRIMEDQGSTSSEGVVKVRTRGQVSKEQTVSIHALLNWNIITQPITLVPVAGCRVPSSDASRRTVKRRSEDIGRVRSFTSGGDTRAQIAAEVKSLSKVEREELLQKAQLPVYIPTEHALAMKADLGITWNTLRILRR